MNSTPRYMDGFLAAVRPANGRDRNDPPPAAPPQEGTATPVPAPAPAAPAELPALSPEEEIKRRLHPLDAFARLLECAQENLPPDADDGFRFQWFGLFYQAPRQDAFLLRLRLPGGRLAGYQCAGLAAITQECGSGQIVLNEHGGLDVPGVPVRMAAEVLRRVGSIGLSGRGTGGDCVRSVRGGEYAGLVDDGFQERVAGLAGALELALAYHRAPADLPRGCEIVFRTPGEAGGGPGLEEGSDTVVFQAMPDEPSPSFLLVLPDEAKGGFLMPSKSVVPACLRLLEVWAAGGDRTDRRKAGLATFCAAAGREKIGTLLGPVKWQDLPASPGWVAKPNAHPGPGGVPVPAGRLLSGQLASLEKIIREWNLSGIRLVRGNLHVAAAADGDAILASIREALAET